jgi:hypothetical protein
LTFCFFLFLFSIFFNDHCISLFFLKKKREESFVIMLFNSRKDSD